MLPATPRSCLQAPWSSQDTAWATSLGLKLSYQQKLVSAASYDVIGLKFYCQWQREMYELIMRMSLARYKSAYIAMLVGYTIKLLMVFLLYAYMARENRARDAAGYTNDDEGVEAGML